MSTQHTPGPWKALAGGVYCGEFYESANMICHMEEHGDGTRIPNQLLIVAAPDLLAALEAILSHHANNTLFSGSDHWNQAREAIYLAKGE